LVPDKIHSAGRVVNHTEDDYRLVVFKPEIYVAVRDAKKVEHIILFAGGATLGLSSS
jgi:hypothetical protein